jgi:hypothetical protein
MYTVVEKKNNFMAANVPYKIQHPFLHIIPRKVGSG